MQGKAVSPTHLQKENDIKNKKKAKDIAIALIILACNLFVV